MSSEILTQIDLAQTALAEAKAQTLAAQAALVDAKETEKKAATAIQLLNKKLQAAVRTERDEAKKPASAGTLAWQAFVAHAQAEQPSRFLGISKMSEKLAIAKAIREEDECGYAFFVSAWKMKNSPAGGAAAPLPLPPSPALSAITLVADVEEALQLAAEEELEPAAHGKSWSVHDSHTWDPSGTWAKTYVSKGLYGCGIHPTMTKDGAEKSPGANMDVESPLGGTCRVSKIKWADAKLISVGDTLYLGDTVGNKVFKGRVLEQPIPGPFSSQRCLEKSWFNALCLAPTPRRHRPAGVGPRHTDVELCFKVSWEEIGPLSTEWRSCLSTSLRRTILPLNTSPPA